jgi:homogentisate phytyltransferase/homogentisate geranylgeranyltransferase
VAITIAYPQKYKTSLSRVYRYEEVLQVTTIYYELFVMLTPGVLFAFSRPHTIAGTLVSVPAIGSYVGGNSIDALPAALFANLFVVGLNQISDIHVDKINKPDLPLASGRMTTNEANRVVAAAGTVALVSSCRSPALQITVILSMSLGTLYSVGKYRLKQSPTMAALSIIAVRGIIINVGFASHALRKFTFPIGPVTFFGIFALVIAILKDVPDLVGDKECGIPSFAVQLGRSPVIIASSTLLCCALGAVATTSPLKWISSSAVFTVLIVLQKTTRALVYDSKCTVVELYRTIWKIFFTSYLAMFFM